MAHIFVTSFISVCTYNLWLFIRDKIYYIVSYIKDSPLLKKGIRWNVFGQFVYNTCSLSEKSQYTQNKNYKSSGEGRAKHKTKKTKLMKIKYWMWNGTSNQSSGIENTVCLLFGNQLEVGKAQNVFYMLKWLQFHSETSLDIWLATLGNCLSSKYSYSSFSLRVITAVPWYIWNVNILTATCKGQDTGMYC